MDVLSNAMGIWGLEWINGWINRLDVSNEELNVCLHYG